MNTGRSDKDRRRDRSGCNTTPSAISLNVPVTWACPICDSAVLHQPEVLEFTNRHIAPPPLSLSPLSHSSAVGLLSRKAAVWTQNPSRRKTQHNRLLQQPACISKLPAFSSTPPPLFVSQLPPVCVSLCLPTVPPAHLLLPQRRRNCLMPSRVSSSRLTRMRTGSCMNLVVISRTSWGMVAEMSTTCVV